LTDFTNCSAPYAVTLTFGALGFILAETGIGFSHFYDFLIHLDLCRFYTKTFKAVLACCAAFTFDWP